MRWILLLLLAAADCARPVKVKHGVAEAPLLDFLDFPEKYRGRVVHLQAVELARDEIRRPLVFIPSGQREREIVVLDPRGLVRREKPRAGPVSIHFECTEGRTDRGNLLLAMEPAARPAL